jgi:hypothetical protein
MSERYRPFGSLGVADAGREAVVAVDGEFGEVDGATGCRAWRCCCC